MLNKAIEITPEELKKRRAGIDYAIATNGLEGIYPTAEERAVMERYASGEITSEELSLSLDKMAYGL